MFRCIKGLIMVDMATINRGGFRGGGVQQGAPPPPPIFFFFFYINKYRLFFVAHFEQNA